MVETVGGPVDAGALGVTLPHEHVFIMRPEALQNFGHVWGSASYWDEDVRVADAIEKLAVARAGGIETIVDPTVLGLGRYIPRIQRVNAAVDINLVVATGIYAFLELTDFLATRTDDVITGWFVRELREGIDDTGERPRLPARDRRPGRLPGLRPLRHRALQHNPRSHPHPARPHRRGPDLLRINRSLLPALRDGGVTEEQIAQMMVENPRRFLAGV
jgi:predicted metal-dependent phosphotriesterase family hydrolase